MRREYGIILNDYQAMEKLQDYKCAICKGGSSKTRNGRRFHIDHDHNSKTVRGLLCGHCNRMLGCAKDNPIILIAGATYLKQHNKTTLYKDDNQSKKTLTPK